MILREVADGSARFRNSGVLDATYAIRTDRGYKGFSHAAMLDPRLGFLRPELFLFSKATSIGMSPRSPREPTTSCASAAMAVA